MDVEYCLADGLDVDECVDGPPPTSDSVTDPDILRACCAAVPDNTVMGVRKEIFGR